MNERFNDQQIDDALAALPNHSQEHYVDISQSEVDFLKLARSWESSGGRH